MISQSRIPDSTEPSATRLVTEILEDIHRLASQQFQLLKAELREELDRTKRAARFGAMGIVLLTLGGGTLIACLVNLLHEELRFSMWASCLLIGGMLSAAGLAFAVIASSLVTRFNPLPDKTIDTLRENLAWQTQPQA
ncbi:MAG: phage holin family protein [Gemmataceae bacterium]